MPEIDYPPTFNFGVDVVDHFARTSDGPALIWANQAGEEARYSFSEVADVTTRLAASLARHGVAKGDRVIVMLPRIPQWQFAIVALLKLGAVPVPCIEMLSPKDLAYRAGKAGIGAVIARAELAHKFDGIDGLTLKVAVGEVPGWQSFDTMISAEPENFSAASVAADDPAILYFTSGSTGQPKGVLHAARGVYLWRASAMEWLDLGRNDVMWCTADTGWSKAGTSILFGPWSCGACAFFYDGPFEPAQRLELLARYGITVYCAAGTELLRVLDEDPAGKDLSRLRRTVSAGEALTPIAVERWQAAFGHQIAEAYGQTETLMSVGYTPSTPYRMGSAGLSLAHNEIAIIDEEGRALPPGEEGDIAIRAPNPQFMLGYWDEPERTQGCYRSGPQSEWFVTGDRGVTDDDGYIYHRGRQDDVINSSGYRIGPSEIEDVLAALPFVVECAAVGAPDPARGEVVAAFIVLRPGYTADEALSRQIQDSVKAATAPYKYPRIVRFVDALPKTMTGKVQRNVLRQNIREQQRAGTENQKEVEGK